MRLSVIIPTYNRSRYLEDLLTTLSAQTKPPDEIIVVDDHSTDATLAVASAFQQKFSSLRYVVNNGRYQQAAKRTGLTYATGDYIGFLDDDIVIEDSTFFERLRHYLRPNRLVQAKVILENLGKRNEAHTRWFDYFTKRPWPLLEISTLSWHRGSQERSVYPLIEFGTFWPARLKDSFIDANFVMDAYGESYGSALRLWRTGIELLLVPALIIRHPGAPSGGSQRFNKKSLVHDFTEFHYGYFYNMVYLHARYWPGWIWLWLPYFLAKTLVAVALNHNVTGWWRYGIAPIGAAVRQHWLGKRYA